MTRLLSALRPEWLLLLLAVVVFSDACFGSGVFYQRDLLGYWYPQIEVFRRLVAEGTGPWWNPYASFGAPMFADPASQLAYPPTWLVLALQPAALRAQLQNWNPEPWVTDQGLLFRNDLDFYLNSYSKEEIKYMRKQVDRAESALRWLGGRVGPTGFGKGFGLPEIALVAAVDWIRLRSALPLEEHDRLVRAAAHWSSRASVAATVP